MKDLVVRLSALDADAGAAIEVISYFDALVESKAGLTSVVRGAAVLAGCPARLVDDARHLVVRVDADGVARAADGPADPGWPCAALPRDGAMLWLERDGPSGAVDAMVLDRTAAALVGVLDRTRGATVPAVSDDGLTEVVLDAGAAVSDRHRAARRLGLGDTARHRALALGDGSAQVSPLTGAVPDRGRVGVGPAVPAVDLPSSLAAARTALRFTAAGTERDPGPRVMYAEALGGLTVLADAIGPGSPPIPDVVAVTAASSAHPWLLATLEAVGANSSLRLAATQLNVHHSSLQDRVIIAERLLGWDVRDASGRLRLQLALTLRRLYIHSE